jgi:hypothetical protein
MRRSLGSPESQAPRAGSGANGSDANGTATPSGGASDANAATAPSSNK